MALGDLRAASLASTLGVAVVGLLSLFGVGACATAQPEPVPEPVPVDLTPPSPQRVSARVTIDEVRVLKLESFPVKAFAYVTGYLPEEGAELDEPVQTRTGNLITIELTATRIVAAVPMTQLVPFERQIPLDILGLPAGSYRAVVNGVGDDFVLDRDNGSPPGPAGGPGPFGEPGPVGLRELR